MEPTSGDRPSKAKSARPDQPVITFYQLRNMPVMSVPENIIPNVTTGQVSYPDAHSERNAERPLHSQETHHTSSADLILAMRGPVGPASRCDVGVASRERRQNRQALHMRLTRGLLLGDFHDSA